MPMRGGRPDVVVTGGVPGAVSETPELIRSAVGIFDRVGELRHDAADDDRAVLRYAVASNVTTLNAEFRRESVYAGPHLLVVASGIQHMSSPVLPSVLAVEELHWLDAAPASDSDLGPSLERGLEGLRNTFRRLLASDPASKGTGVLLTAMRWRGTHAAIAHIGRSRIYMLRGGELTQLTRDHTFAQLRMEAGEIRPDEMYSDARDYAVFRWLDDECTEPADIIAHEAAIGDRYVLCTDGIERIMSARTLVNIVSNTASSPQDVADEMVGMAFPLERYRPFGCVVCDVVERTG